MSGKQPISMHVYDLEGNHIKTYKSQSEFREKYYQGDIGKRPLLVHKENGINYHINKDLEIIALEKRIGRENIRFLIAIHNSEYCKDTDSDAIPVGVYNLRGELIAEFKSRRLLLKLTNVKQATLHRHLKNNGSSHKFSEHGLFFRYKEED